MRHLQEIIERYPEIGKSVLFNGIRGMTALKLLEELDAGVIRLSQGDPLVKLGTEFNYRPPPKSIWIIANGSVEILLDGKRVATRNAPEVLGELEFFFPGERPLFEITASRPTEFVTIPLARLRASPHCADLVRNLGAIAAEKLKRADEALIECVKTNTDLNRIIDRSINDYFRERSTTTSDSAALRTVTPQKGKFVIWFSDLVGYSAAVRNLEPLQVQQLVSRALNDQQEAIVQSEGHVDKFMGDGVMGFWPVANSPEDRHRQSHLALKAALGTVVRLASAGVDTVAKLRLRLGLHYGEALFGNFGSHDRWQLTLIGQDVNTAARLEQHKDSEAGDDSNRAVIRISPAFAECLGEDLLKVFSAERVMTAKHNEQIKYRSCAVSNTERAEELISQINGGLGHN
jgi:class 3 adenylate cyclase